MTRTCKLVLEDLWGQQHWVRGPCCPIDNIEATIIVRDKIITTLLFCAPQYQIICTLMLAVLTSELEPLCTGLVLCVFYVRFPLLIGLTMAGLSQCYVCVFFTRFLCCLLSVAAQSIAWKDLPLKFLYSSTQPTKKMKPRITFLGSCCARMMVIIPDGAWIVM